MNWYTGIMVYLVIWWCVLFAVLPFGVRTPEEAGVERGAGHAPSAPVKPYLVRKALATTAIAALLFLGFVYVEAHDLFGIGAYWRASHP